MQHENVSEKREICEEILFCSVFHPEFLLAHTADEILMATLMWWDALPEGSAVPSPPRHPAAAQRRVRAAARLPERERRAQHPALSNTHRLLRWMSDAESFRNFHK